MAKMNVNASKLGGSFACLTKRQSSVVNVLRRPTVNKKKDNAVRAVINLCLKGKVGKSHSDIKTALTNQLSEEEYDLEATRQADIYEATHWVTRYIDWESRQMSKGGEVTVSLNPEMDANVYVDYYFSSDMKINKDLTVPCITASKIKCKVRDVSTSGRTPDTSIYENKEIFSLILAAKKEAERQGLKSFFVRGEYIYLRIKDDGKPTSKCPSGWQEFSPKVQQSGYGFLVEDGKLSPEGERAILRYQKSLDTLMEGYGCTKTQCQACDLYEKCFYKVTPKGVVKEEKPVSVASMSFSPQQKAIIAHNKGVARVIAGAGSGKTTVSVMNTGTKIGNGEDASKILCITFTNAGALATRRKLSVLLEDYGLEEEAGKVHIMTFHSLWQSIIQKYFEKLGYKEMPVIEDMIEQYDAVKSILAETGLVVPNENYQYPTLSNKNFHGVIPSLLITFNKCKELGISTKEEMMDSLAFDSEKAEVMETLFALYLKKMKEQCSVSYDDLARLVMDIHKEVPTLFEEDFVFEHILVDEFQDSSKQELDIVKFMTKTSHFKSLMVVGDDLQAIYGFRGGDVDLILNLPKYLGCPVQDYYLTDNYRSTEEIILAANRQASRVTKRLPKTLVSKCGSEKKPELWGFENRKNEYPVVAQAIKDLVDSGVSLSDIAFLGSKRSDVANMQSELTKLGVYALPTTPMRYMDNSKVLAVIGLAEYLADDTALTGLFNFLNALMDNNLSLDEVGEKLFVRNSNVVKNLWLSMNDDEKKAFFLSLVNALDDGDDIFKSFLDTVNQRKGRHIKDIIDYVIKHKLYSSTGEARIEGEFNAVTCTTLHSSKGLEWKYVFLSLSTLDDLKSNFNTERSDEIRRLLFVGITRAQKELVISSVKRYNDGLAFGKYNTWYQELQADDAFDHNAYRDKHILEAEMAEREAKKSKAS